jgi:hypothetical protein
MPGISQSESLSPALPIENSPPGIQTIPGGAGDRGDVAFVTVDAKEEDTSGTRVGDDASVDWRGDVGRSAYTVNDAAMTKPSISSQPTYDRRTSGDFFLRFIRHLSKAKNTSPVVFHTDDNPAPLHRFVMQRAVERFAGAVGEAIAPAIQQNYSLGWPLPALTCSITWVRL